LRLVNVTNLDLRRRLKYKPQAPFNKWYFDNLTAPASFLSNHYKDCYQAFVQKVMARYVYSIELGVENSLPSHQYGEKCAGLMCVQGHFAQFLGSGNWLGNFPQFGQRLAVWPQTVGEQG
jgi:hypothetical protein